MESLLLAIALHLCNMLQMVKPYWSQWDLVKTDMLALPLTEFHMLTETQKNSQPKNGPVSYLRAFLKFAHG